MLDSLQKIPLILIHGTLGSGKTTLVQNLLSLPQFQNSIVIENEFANENIDKVILEQNYHHQTFEISGQCICCSSGEELENTLNIIARDFPDKVIMLETTGVANSIQLIQKLFLSGDFLDNFQILKNIFVLDPLETSPDLIASESADIKLSDIAIINKTDLASEKVIKKLATAINQISSTTKVITTSGASVSFEDLNLTEISPIEDVFANLYEDLVASKCPHSLPSYAIFKSDQPIPSQNLEQVIKRLQKREGVVLKRVKGYIFDGSTWWMLQATQHHFEKGEVKPSNLKASKLVFIGENIDQSTISDFEKYLYE